MNPVQNGMDNSVTTTRQPAASQRCGFTFAQEDQG
jgi:hypothetical protein